MRAHPIVNWERKNFPCQLLFRLSNYLRGLHWISVAGAFVLSADDPFQSGQRRSYCTSVIKLRLSLRILLAKGNLPPRLVNSQ